MYQCFTFRFNVSSPKTLWERFKNTMGAIQKHNGSDSKTLWERIKNTEGAIQKH